MLDEFAKDSVIVCPECLRPIYALERGIGPADRAGRSAAAFRPLRWTEIIALVERDDLDAGWRLSVRDWMRSPAVQGVLQAERPTAGADAVCPNCDGCWVQFEERAEESVHDRGYRLLLWDIPPVPAGLMRKLRWSPDGDGRDIEIIERPVA